MSVWFCVKNANYYTFKTDNFWTLKADNLIIKAFAQRTLHHQMQNKKEFFSGEISNIFFLIEMLEIT